MTSPLKKGYRGNPFGYHDPLDDYDKPDSDAPEDWVFTMRQTPASIKHDISENMALYVYDEFAFLYIKINNQIWAALPYEMRKYSVLCSGKPYIYADHRTRKFKVFKP